jgi:hypothetical protein
VLDFLAQRGIKIDEKELDAMIEAIVWEIKKP